MNIATLNHRLASALGWTDITSIAGVLLGTPPGGNRAAAKLPNWTGDQPACDFLALEHRIQIEPMSTGVAASGVFEFYIDHPDRSAAARCAVVKAVTLQMEMKQ